MAMTCIFRLIQLHRPPSTQASVSRSNAVLGATRSNVLERSAAQHGAGKALRHQRRGCAVLRRSAAGALGTSDRASRAAVQVPLGRQALASFGNPFFFDLLCGSRCESTPKPSRQWRRARRRAGRVGGPQVWTGPPPPLLCYYPLNTASRIVSDDSVGLSSHPSGGEEEGRGSDQSYALRLPNDIFLLQTGPF